MTMTNQALAARAAQYRRWAREPNPAAALAPARAGFRARFEREVDAMGLTDDTDRARRVDQLMRAHMAEMARKSASVRKAQRDALAAKAAQARDTQSVNEPA